MCIAEEEFSSGTLSMQNITVTDDDNVTISQWWTLVGMNELPLSKYARSRDVLMVVYSERVSQLIFSFIAGLG